MSDVISPGDLINAILLHVQETTPWVLTTIVQHRTTKEQAWYNLHDETHQLYPFQLRFNLYKACIYITDRSGIDRTFDLSAPDSLCRLTAYLKAVYHINGYDK